VFAQLREGKRFTKELATALMDHEKARLKRLHPEEEKEP
jgi:hypothetical protein